MLKNRLIPVLFLKDGFLVRSEKFSVHQILGNPIAQVERYNSWDVDELIYIDISSSDSYSRKRIDLGEGKADSNNIVDLINIVSKKCFMPLTVGGRIRNLEEIRTRLHHGADKITINAAAIEDPDFITSASKCFGSQAIVVSMDVKKNADGDFKIFIDHGLKETNWTPEIWAQEVQKHGAGEIFLNSIDRDGTAEGYDNELIKRVVNAVNIPVIACGGVATYSDFGEMISYTNASAAAAGNIFHFRELSYSIAKKQLKAKNFNFR